MLNKNKPHYFNIVISRGVVKDEGSYDGREPVITALHQLYPTLSYSEIANRLTVVDYSINKLVFRHYIAQIPCNGYDEANHRKGMVLAKYFPMVVAFSSTGECEFFAQASPGESIVAEAIYGAIESSLRASLEESLEGLKAVISER